MRKLTLSQKLVLTGGSLVAFPMIVLGIVALWNATSTMSKVSKQGSQELARNLAVMTRTILQEELQKATMIAGSINVQKTLTDSGPKEDRIEQMRRDLLGMLKGLGSLYEGVFAADRSGRVVGGVTIDGKTKVYQGLDVSGRDYFQKVVASQRPRIGEAILSKISRRPVVVMAAPVFSPHGDLAGIVGLTARLDFFTDVISKAKAGKKGYAFMVDGSGTIIAHPKKSLVMKLNLLADPGLAKLGKALTRGRSGVVRYVFQGVAKGSGYAPVGLNGWAIGVTQPVSEYMGPVHKMAQRQVLYGAVFLLFALAAFFFFSRSVTKPVVESVVGLAEGADQVAAASSQIASASQQLAEGASSQAASLEETSSAMEEMASMMLQNADSAKEANVMAKETAKDVGRALESMKALTSSMDEISTASEETQKIIKTIDEIAFQTNLLALNAAVEAARAGEAGAGFAVVADEVRNLALRSAEAAKTTAELIEDTVKKVQGGSSLLGETDEAFSRVAQKTSKIEDLMGEIAVASEEHAKGIDQVNRAIADMDKVVQQNAANAEESASSSEELSAQAEQMRGFVLQLTAMVGGDRIRVGNGGSHSEKGRIGHGPKPGMKRPAVTKGNGKAHPPVARRGGETEVRPEELIPFDDEMSDF